MKIFYKGGRGLAFSQRERGTSFRKEKPPRLSKELTHPVGGKSSGLPSSTAWQAVDVSSKYPRVLFDPCSGAVREVFGSCSGGTRRTPEGHPKDYRRSPEPFPKRTRSASEEQPNNIRRNRWFFQRFLGTLKAGIKYRCSKDVVPFTQLLRKRGEVRLIYQECTVNVLGVYRKGTKEVLRRYWRATKDLLNACTSVVHQQYSKRRRVVGVEAMTNKVTFCLTGLLCFTRKLLSLMALKNKSMPSVLALICFMLFNLSNAWAQSAETRTAEGQTEIKPLQIGDTIPEELWNLPLQVVNHPTGKDTITLNDYRDKKLIILDFWATWCGSCIASFPRIREVEKQYADAVSVIPVTGEDAPQVSKFLSSNGTLKSLHLYSVVANKMLQTFFPHQYIPHYIWFSGEGVVGAITSNNRVNAINVNHFLLNNSEQIPSRTFIDPERPLFLSDAMELDALTHFSLLTKESHDGLPTGNRKRIENEIVRGRAFTNTSLLHMYTVAGRGIFAEKGIPLTEKRIITESDEGLGSSQERDIIKNIYNYELVVPLLKADSLYEYMLSDLNRYTTFYGRVEKRQVKCLVLVPTGELTAVKSRGGQIENSLMYRRPAKIANRPLSDLVLRLNELNYFDHLLIDETGFSEHVDLWFSGETDPEIIKKELNDQNLDIVEEYRFIEVFVISGKS